MKSGRTAFTAVIIIVLIFFPILDFSALTDAGEKSADEIVRAFSAGEDGLREFLRKQKINNPAIADLFLNKGREYFYTLRYKEARESCRIALVIYSELHDLSGQGNVHKGLGDIHLRVGENLQAEETYNRALSLFRKARNLSGEAAVYSGLGELFARKGESDKAFDLYEKARRIHLEIEYAAGRGKVYSNLGDLYLRKRDYPNALLMYDRSLKDFSASGDYSGQGMVYRGIGEIRMRTGNHKEALELMEKAHALLLSVNDIHGQASIYKSIGDVHYYKADNHKALEMYGKARAVFVKADDPVGLGYVDWRMGQTYLRTGDNAKALEMYRRALLYCRKSEDPVGQGDVYYALGHLDYYKRDYAKAMEQYERSLPFYQKAGDPIGQGNASRSIGYVYLMAGSHEKALPQFEKALGYYIKASSPLGQANVYWSMGEAYAFLGDDRKALDMFERALPLYQKVSELVGEGIIYQNMGDIHLRAANYEKARDMNERAMAIYLRANSPVDVAVACRNLGNIYAKAGDTGKALEMYDNALRLSRKVEDIEAEAYVLFRKAEVKGSQGAVAEAVQLYDQGMAKFERVRRQAGFSELKKTFMEKVYDQYESATVFMIENRYREKAFEYAESMKARVFLDQLAEGLVDLEKGIDRELKEKRDGIENRLNTLQKRITDESRGRNPDEAKIRSLKSEYAGAENELEAVKREIHYKNPLYSSVQYPEPVKLNSLQKTVLRENEVILEYFVSRDGIYCFVISRDTYQIVKLNAAETNDNAKDGAGLTQQKALEDRVNQLLELLRSETPWWRQKRIAAVKLYEILIRPVEKHLQDRTVIIIPDGILTRLPFEVLTVKDEDGTKYLTEKYRIKYVQSASVLGILRTQYKREGVSDQFIGFGDPVYDYERFKSGKKETGSDTKGGGKVSGMAGLTRNGYERAGGKLDRLAGSGKEIKSISRIFKEKSRQGDSLLRLDARESYAKSKDLERYGYIHFSTHGILNDKFQAIALSQIPGEADDGYLTLGEIMNSRYNAHLVVLSACQTGLGKMERGEGITGLTRAVMYAGSPAAVVSLWSVSDEGTKELMIRFYRNLLAGGMPKEEALRAAKLEMIGRKEFRHPYFWSAFVMYGE